MSCLIVRSCWAAFFLLLPLRLNAAPPATFAVTGAVAQPDVWSVARLRHDLAGQVRAVSYTLKGQHHTAHCVPLMALLQASHPRVNPQIKHHILQFIVAARGQDGYTADFSLAELSPDLGHEAVWVALDRDGSPLDGDDGPVELLVPGDLKAARWVHGLASLTVVDEAQALSGGR